MLGMKKKKSPEEQAAAHGVWALVSLSNVYVLNFLGGYWGNAAETAPLTHTWSLGVEEQFYLLYPALLVALARTQRARLRIWLTTIAVASFASPSITGQIGWTPGRRLKEMFTAGSCP